MCAPLFRAAIITFAALLAACPAIAAGPRHPTAAAAKGEPVQKPHRVVIQVDQNDPAVMNLALNNASNVIDYYRSQKQEVSVDLVTYGPGLHMLRADTSPVKDLFRVVRGLAPDIRFVVCEATKLGMERAEGHPLVLLDNVDLVPNGPGRIIELQEAGWSYIRS